MMILSCPKSRCTWKTDDVGETTGLKLIELHLTAKHGEKDVKQKAQGGAKVEKPRRPEVSPDMSADRWAYFLARWKSYNPGAALKGPIDILQIVK